MISLVDRRHRGGTTGIPFLILLSSFEWTMKQWRDPVQEAQNREENPFLHIFPEARKSCQLSTGSVLVQCHKGNDRTVTRNTWCYLLLFLKFIFKNLYYYGACRFPLWDSIPQRQTPCKARTSRWFSNQAVSKPKNDRWCYRQGESMETTKVSIDIPALSTTASLL